MDSLITSWTSRYVFAVEQLACVSVRIMSDVKVLVL